MMTKQQALKAGHALRKRLHGDNWKVNVWENIGWHYAVETKRLSVRGPAFDGDTCRCLLKPHYSFFGEVGHGIDPNRAVSQVLRNAVRSLNEYQGILSEALNKI